MKFFFEIQHLTSGYDKEFHIREIGFAVPKGSFTGIIGPNGSGKTTLFKTISGELPVEAGGIYLSGQKLNRLSLKKKARHLAVVTQDIVSAAMSVEEFVLMGRYPYQNTFQFFETSSDREIAEKFMRLTGILHLRDKDLSHLSGGERQLAAIAKALTQEPDLLLLDEPTAHLDISHQVQILNLVQQMNEQLGLTVLMVIHDLNLAGEYCDQLVMMENGSIHVKGTPEEVLTYDHIERVYRTVVVTKENPVSGKPLVFLVSDKVLHSLNMKGNGHGKM